MKLFFRIIKLCECVFLGDEGTGATGGELQWTSEETRREGKMVVVATGE